MSRDTAQQVPTRRDAGGTARGGAAPSLPAGRRGRLRTAIRRTPFTAVLVLLVLVTSAVGEVVRVIAREALGAADPFLAIDVLRPFAVVAVTSGVIALLATLAGVVLLVGTAERLMGWRRTALAFVVTTVVGTGVGAVLSFADTDGRNPLQLVLGRATSFDPWTAIVGTIVTASAFAGALWRRRIRVNAAAVVAGMLLFDGHAADLYAAVAVAAGVGLGELLRRAPRRAGWTRSSHRETRVLLATVVMVTAIGPVIAIVSRARVGLLAPLAVVLGGGPTTTMPSCSVGVVTDVCTRGLSRFQLHGPFALLLAVMPMLVLAVGAVGLFRGSRFALWLVVGVDVVTAGAAATLAGIVPQRVRPDVDVRLAEDHLAVSLSLAASVLVPLGTAVVLVARRSAFPVRAPRRRIGAFAVAVAVTAAALVVALVLIAAASGRTVGDPFRVALTVLGPVSPVTLPAAALVRNPFLHLAVVIAGPVLWGVAALAAIRPAWASVDPGGARGDRARARRLLIASGGDVFGWMTTWSGNAYWFAEDGRAGIAYRRSGRVAVTVGGPFGVADARDEVLAGFARFCDDNGWTPVLYGVDPGTVEPLVRRGWETLPVAEDADLDPRTWTTAGKRKQDVRTAVNRAAREGITAVWAPWHELPAPVARQITAISEEWVADRDLPEMGFTLGGVDEMQDPDVRVLVALDAAGTALAVTSWLPSYEDGRVVGWTLDVMRRTDGAPNGVMEFLVASAAERMRDDGAARLSLSAAPLASTAAPGDTQQGGVSSLLDLVGGVLEPVYGFRSLLRFKAKFGPDLHPLVMAFPDPVALPSIGIAIVRTYLPDLTLRQAVALVRGRGTA